MRRRVAIVQESFSELCTIHNQLYPKRAGKHFRPWISLSGRTRPIITKTPPDPGTRTTGWPILGDDCKVFFGDSSIEIELPEDAEVKAELLTAEDKNVWLKAIVDSYRPEPKPKPKPKPGPEPEPAPDLRSSSNVVFP